MSPEDAKRLREDQARRMLAREFVGRGMDAAAEVNRRGAELGVVAQLVLDGGRLRVLVGGEAA